MFHLNAGDDNDDV